MNSTGRRAGSTVTNPHGGGWRRWALTACIWRMAWPRHDPAIRRRRQVEGPVCGWGSSAARRPRWLGQEPGDIGAALRNQANRTTTHQLLSNPHPLARVAPAARTVIDCWCGTHPSSCAGQAVCPLPNRADIGSWLGRPKRPNPRRSGLLYGTPLQAASFLGLPPSGVRRRQSPSESAWVGQARKTRGSKSRGAAGPPPRGCVRRTSDSDQEDQRWLTNRS